MDLKLTAEELKFRDQLRAWLKVNVPKDWDEWREETLEARFDYLKRWQRKLYEGGWAGISWPTAYGGRGAGLMQQVIFWQEMALAEAPPMANSLGLGLVGPTIIAFGTERSEEHTSELQSLTNLVCRLLLEKKKKKHNNAVDHLIHLPTSHP